MKEVEVKAKVSDLSKIRTLLEKKGVQFSDTVIQKDIIYCEEKVLPRFGEFMSGSVFLRIRDTGDKVYFTLKKSESNELDSVERETIISDLKQMEDAILLMGYVEGARVNKMRRTGKYGDYEICLDEVEGLGSFIEVEVISDKDASILQSEMFSFLEKLGIKKEDQVLKGYDTMLFNQNKDR